ncbi:MAG TPA: hypothetical protein VLV15_01010 [Dongiaceae bacterium]|nr:hypothetical protein [Dongiaceae bacterium]
MHQSPSGWLAPVLGLLAACAGVASAETGAIRGIYRPSEYGFTGPRGCILPTNVPRFDALALHAETPGHAESLATRLGFTAARSGGREWRVSVPLGPDGGGLVWRDGRRDAAMAIRSATQPVSLQTLTFLPPDPELPFETGRVAGNPAPQPNGARGIIYLIGLVSRIDRTAERWPPEHTRETGGGVPLLDLRDPYRIPDLDARACDAPGVGWSGHVRLLEPFGTTGFAAGRVARGGTGWIGCGLSVDDPKRSAAWLDAHGVRYTRDLVANRVTLRLDPVETDGLLIELVGPPLQPTP